MERFYAASAVCTPTRASILTGRYPLRFDIRGIFHDDEAHLPRGTTTLPTLLKHNGYRTAHLGKWHHDEPVPESDPYFRMHLTDIIGAESIRLVEQFPLAADQGLVTVAAMQLPAFATDEVQVT
jgi:arylsulfatase A-like enzyme